MELRALVVYESMFGNTKDVAEAVAAGLSDRFAVDVADTGSAPRAVPEGVALLVVGGPTHAFGMSRSTTRADAVKQGAAGVAVEAGLREWLAGLGPARSGTIAAAFDTRVSRPRVPGSAARAAAKQLRRLGFPSADQPRSFWVHGTPGPLLDGEKERARRWGETLAGAAVSQLDIAAHTRKARS